LRGGATAGEEALEVVLRAEKPAFRRFKDRLVRAGDPAHGDLRPAAHDAAQEGGRVHAADWCGGHAPRSKTRAPRCFSGGHQSSYEEGEKQRATDGDAAGGVCCWGHWWFRCNNWSIPGAQAGEIGLW
jgi:hypothetical protein